MYKPAAKVVGECYGGYGIPSKNGKPAVCKADTTGRCTSGSRYNRLAFLL